MIFFTLKDSLNIQISSDNKTFFKDLTEHLSIYAKNFRFTPAYKLHRWDGKICLFNAEYNTIKFGLYTEVVRFIKRKYPNEKLTIDDDVKALFRGTTVEPKFDLKYQPRPYQETIIRSCLKFSCGVVKAATSAGKSLCIAYITKTLFENNLINKQLIIVPTLTLIEQFVGDLVEYGFDKNLIGRVNKDFKEFDKQIVIATWQSLKNRKKDYIQFQSIMVDETQGAHAKELFSILSNCYWTKYKFGVTGTLPSHRLDLLQIQSVLGPILESFDSNSLANEGFISKANIKSIEINYKEKPKGDYFQIKEAILSHPYRLDLISQIVSSCNGSTLLLVKQIEEGRILEEKLKSVNFLENKTIIFLSGKDSASCRQEWRKTLNERNDVIMIATYGIFSVGVNVPTLKYLILASPSKSKILVLQSIGRALRKHGLKDSAVIFDICDQVKYLKSHGKDRKKYYAMENFDVEDIIIYEGDVFSPTKNY